MSLVCKVSWRGMSAASYLFVDEVTVVTPFKEVSWAVRVWNVASIEQIRRKRSARLKGMAFFVWKGWQDE